MIGMFLAPFSFAGGNLGSILVQLENMGFFSIALPFLLVFAIVFGVLSKIHILGDNKAINGVIAISVGLMALQFGYVTQFFSKIFPQLGIGLSVLLVILIVLGLFNKEGKWPVGIMIGIGGIIASIIIATSFNDPFFNYGIPLWITNNLGWFLPIAVITGLMAWVWSSTQPKNTAVPAILQKLFATNP